MAKTLSPTVTALLDDVAASGEIIHVQAPGQEAYLMDAETLALMQEAATTLLSATLASKPIERPGRPAVHLVAGPEMDRLRVALAEG